MRYGCAWYPEHWDEDRWEVDLALMRSAGMNVVRVGEFAWARMEPLPGLEDLDWLERAINRAAAHGLVTVLCTPTASPPAWLTRAHPEILRVLPDGRVQGHGWRGHGNPLHPLYLDWCRRIVTALADRFGQHPQVIGWQIDNEFGDLSCDPLTRAAFQNYCQTRYGSLEALNQAWSTHYWSQTYSDWAEIPFALSGHNACLQTVVRDFSSQIWRAFAQNQAEVLRARIRSGQFLTTNATYEFAKQDPQVLFDGLDLVAADVYLGSGAPLTHLDPAMMGTYLAATRGIRRAPFWVMETQPGTINWFPVNPPMDPGEVRRMVYHQIGQGAEAILFWQWRSAPGGQEQYHGCLIGQGGRPRPIYHEVARTGLELARLATHLQGAEIRTEVAVAWTYRDRGFIDHERYHRDFNPWHHLATYYDSLRCHGLDVDLIDPRTGLSDYRLVVAPHLTMLDPALEDLLLSFVAAGGVLVLGPRSGTRDSNGAYLAQDPPGLRLGAALGGRVEEFYCLTDPLPVEGPAARGTVKLWAEWLTPLSADCQTALTYGPGHPWLSGRPALLHRAHGQGHIAYLGTWPDPTTLHAVAAWACRLAGVAIPWSPLPSGLEVSTLHQGDQRLRILINHGTTDCRLDLPGPGLELLSGQPVAGSLVIPANEVAVVAERI